MMINYKIYLFTGLFFICFYYSDGQIIKKNKCYLKVDFTLQGQTIYTNKIVCHTQETQTADAYMTELKLGDMVSDTSITLVRYFNLGRRRKIKKLNSVHIMLQLIDQKGDIIQKIDGEILPRDMICG